MIHRCLLPLLSFLFSTAGAGALDWPQRRGPSNDGHSTETQWSHQWPASGPKAIWTADVGTGFSSFAVAGGLLFTAGNTNDTDTLVALDAGTGVLRWRFDYPEKLGAKMYEGGPNSTPTVARGQVFFTSKTGFVLCLDAVSGALSWSNRLSSLLGADNGSWGAAGSPLVDGDRVYINYGTALVALKRTDGSVLWKAAQEAKAKFSFTTPLLASWGGEPGAVVLAHMNKSLFALSPADGRTLWQHKFGSGYETHCSDPVLLKNGVFLSSGDDGGERLEVSASGVTRRWKNKNLATHMGPSVLVDGFLYGVDAGAYKKGQQMLRCVDLDSGEVKWQLPGFGQGSLIVAGDRLIVLDERGEILVVRASPGKGEILSRAQILGGKCWTQPALANGLLYCRNAAGRVVCLDLRQQGPG